MGMESFGTGRPHQLGCRSSWKGSHAGSEGAPGLAGRARMLATHRATRQAANAGSRHSPDQRRPATRWSALTDPIVRDRENRVPRGCVIAPALAGTRPPWRTEPAAGLHHGLVGRELTVLVSIGVNRQPQVIEDALICPEAILPRRIVEETDCDDHAGAVEQNGQSDFGQEADPRSLA